MSTPVVSITNEVPGSTSTASQIKILAVPLTTAYAFNVRIKICEEDSFTESVNAVIALIIAKSTIIRTITAGKDIEFRSATLDGEVWVTVTNAVAETVTLRIGPPEFGMRILDYTKTLNITHA